MQLQILHSKQVLLALQKCDRLNTDLNVCSVSGGVSGSVSSLSCHKARVQVKSRVTLWRHCAESLPLTLTVGLCWRVRSRHIRGSSLHLSPQATCLKRKFTRSDSQRYHCLYSTWNHRLNTGLMEWLKNNLCDNKKAIMADNRYKILEAKDVSSKVVEMPSWMTGINYRNGKIQPIWIHHIYNDPGWSHGGKKKLVSAFDW